MSPKPNFFHTMVVVSSSIAAGACGGQAQDSASGESKRGADESSSEDGSGMNLPGTGGSTGLPDGPEPGPIGTGGSAPAGPVFDPSMGGAGPGCEPEQWDCSDGSAWCLWMDEVEGTALPETCSCDLSRPTGPEDCERGEAFTCRSAHFAASGDPLAEEVRHTCTCVAQEDHCDSHCEQAYGLYIHAECSDQGDMSVTEVLCGCAIPLIR